MSAVLAREMEAWCESSDVEVGAIAVPVSAMQHRVTQGDELETSTPNNSGEDRALTSARLCRCLT